MNALRAQFNQTLLRARRARNGLSGLGNAPTQSVPAKWQVDPAALQALVKLAASPTTGTVVAQPTILAPVMTSQSQPGIRSTLIRVPFKGFGALGLNEGESGAVKGAGAGAKVGSVVPVIGTVVGAAVGAIIGYFLSAKHYFNVADSNNMCRQLSSAWQQYVSIQGHVAGRALGFSTMNQLMHAAVGEGLFPGNDMHLSFHQGTLQCAGHGDWVDEFTGSTIQGNPSGTPCGAHNCLPDAFAAYQGQQSAVPPGTPDAVFLVDSILLPMNQSAKIPWVYQGAQNAQVHQLLYDLADAYIAQHGSGSTPYVEYPAAQIASEAVVGAEGAPVTTSSVTSLVPASGAVTSSQPVQVGTDPTSGQPIYQVPGQSGYYSIVSGQLVPYTSTAANSGGAGASYYPTQYPAGASDYTTPTSATPAGATAAISTSGFQMNAGTLALIGGSLLGVYLITEMLEKRKKRAKHHG